MSRKFKAGLFFGLTMFIIFVAQKLFEIDQPTLKDVLKILLSGIIGAGIAGIIFGWLVDTFSGSKVLEQNIKIDLEPGEKLIFQSSANHFKGLEAVGGKLFLTDKRLVFISHKLNIQNHQLNIKLNDIASIGRFKPLGLTNNGLFVIDKKNETEKFVVEKLSEWLIYLKS